MRAEASVLLASISFSFFFFSSIHILFHSSAQSEIFYICFRIIQLCNISRRTAGARAKSYPSKRFQTAPHPQLSLEFRELQTPSDLICSCDKVRLGSARTHTGRLRVFLWKIKNSFLPDRIRQRYRKRSKHGREERRKS